MYPRVTSTHDWNDSEQEILLRLGWKYIHKQDTYRKGVINIEKLYKKCYKIFSISKYQTKPTIITDLKKLVW